MSSAAVSDRVQLLKRRIFIRARARIFWAYVGPCWRYVGRIFALCWAYVGQADVDVLVFLGTAPCACGSGGPLLGLCWPMLGICWTSWGYVGS